VISRLQIYAKFQLHNVATVKIETLFTEKTENY